MIYLKWPDHQLQFSPLVISNYVLGIKPAAAITSLKAITILVVCYQIDVRTS